MAQRRAAIWFEVLIVWLVRNLRACADSGQHIWARITSEWPHLDKKPPRTDLLRAVADGGDVPIVQVYDLARAVIEAPAFQVARQILQGGSPEFAVRKALELAWMVLSTDDGAAGTFAAQTGAVALGAAKSKLSE